MKKPMPRPAADQKGQSLVVILMLGALLAFFGVALTRMIMQESRQVVETKKRDKLFTAGDAAMQRSMGALLASDAQWNNPETISGYASLTVTGYTDIPGLTYYIKIRKNSLEDQTNTGAATDYHTGLWAEVGSDDHDRTIFVRTVETSSGEEDRFYATVHRTPKNYYPGTKGIQAEGCISTAGWEGTTVDTTGGACPTPGVTATPVPCNDGSIQAGCISGNDFCLEVDNTSPGALPTVVIPAGTIPVPGAALVTSDRSYNSAATFGCASCTAGTVVRYQVDDLDFGAKTFTFNAQPGPIEIYVTGTLEISGNANFVIYTDPSWTCCKSKGLTIFVKGNGAITWNGTPNGNFMLYAPESDFQLNGTGNKTFTGAIIAKNVSVSGGGTGLFQYDKCLAYRPAADNYEKPPLITTTWRQIGLK